MKRDVRFSVSVTRYTMQRIQYLADLAGEGVSTWCSNEITRTIEKAMPNGSEEGKLYDQISKLKVKAQGQPMLPAAERELLADAKPKRSKAAGKQNRIAPRRNSNGAGVPTLLDAGHTFSTGADDV